MEEKKALISGFVSGVIHTIVGYPLDTLKTIKQSYKRVEVERKSYRGVVYPVIQVSIVNAIMFGSNDYLKKRCSEKESNLYSGILTTLVCTPLDKYKIMKQYNMKYELNIKNILRTYKNTHIVMARELPATYIYLSTYNYLKKKDLSTFLSGSIAGTLSWFTIYPIDTIKTRIQNNSCITIKDAIYKRNLFTGLTICLIRAFIVNGVNFSVYEQCMNLF